MRIKFMKFGPTQMKVAAYLLGQYPPRPVGSLYTEVPRSGARISNVVFQTWVEPRLGRTHAAYLRAFRELNPDWSFRFYRDAEMDGYLRAHYGDEPIYEIFRNARFGPMRADIWRYCVLHREGGVYVDINKRVDVPLSSFIGPGDAAYLALEPAVLSPPPEYDPDDPPLRNHGRAIANWFMACSAGHPFLRRTIDNIVRAYPQYRNRVVEHVQSAVINFTGPVMLTRSIYEVLREHPDTPFTEGGIHLDGRADLNIRMCWTRYIQAPRYGYAGSQVIVT
jgi:mannosyltransferase OCH1-like enzyme